MNLYCCLFEVAGIGECMTTIGTTFKITALKTTSKTAVKSIKATKALKG